MSKKIWVKIKHKNGTVSIYCTGSKVQTCFGVNFLLAPIDEPNDELDELTRQVNAVIDDFLKAHPDLNLRILSETESGDDVDDLLRFALVTADEEVDLPDSLGG